MAIFMAVYVSLNILLRNLKASKKNPFLRSNKLSKGLLLQLITMCSNIFCH